ncbi:MAG: beta-lactamase family protein [Bacteroidetes bacterium]|nr:beta-lactamase family protein [Bacteroidota bacterium]MBS1930094.1 beta-lactamase family protein [Bacteroidota bacterium]
MKQLIYSILIIFFFSCSKAQISQTRSIGQEIPWKDTSNSNPRNAALKALLDKYNKKGLPGISLLVNDQNGTWVGSAGKSDIENNIDFVPGTVSKAASITKLLIGTLVFKLMEDSIHTRLGYKDLNTKITHWIPQRITNRIANGNEVTLGQCMKHETGIPDLIDQNSFYLAVLNNPNKKWGPEELLSYIYDKKADFAPSDTAVYSNTNYVLISMIIEAQTGRKHSDLLKELVLNPLGMTHTYYQPHDDLPNDVAQGYFDLYNNNTMVNVSNYVTGSGNGYGGIFSNVFDLFRFADALFIKKTLLKPSSLTIMQTWGKQDGSNLYGYGIQKTFLDKGIDAGIGHKGRDAGYSANLFYFPNKGVTHIFFVNYGTDGDSHLRQTFYDFIDELVNITVN